MMAPSHTFVFVTGKVAEWHAATFPGRRPLPTAKKTLEEASELHVAAKPNAQGVTDWNRVRSECADVAITLITLAWMGGFELDQAILEKLDELKTRPNQVQRDAERGIEREP